MADRMVVYSSEGQALPAGDVADRLRAGGVTVLEQTPHMLLVEGGALAVGKIVDDLPGWGLSVERKVERPRTRERITKSP